MLLAEVYAQHEELGAYKKAVSQIRKVIGRFSPKQMASVFDVNEIDCTAVIECIDERPDWDNERVAEEIDWVD